MIYCTFATGDVHLEHNGGLHYICCGCRLYRHFTKLYSSPEELLAHLDIHKELGHSVPQEATDRLELEVYEANARKVLSESVS